MSYCNLCWLFITTSSTKKIKQTETDQHPHSCFLPNLSPPHLVSVSCDHTVGKVRAEHVCLSVCQVLLHLSSVTWGWTTLDLIHLIPSSPGSHPQALSWQQLTGMWKLSWKRTQWMGTHNPECVVKLQGANTERCGPKSSSQVCLLGKGPQQPLSFQDIAEVL